MVSSRALEYITRFTTKGVQKRTVMKKIVEYRDECKGLYHEEEAKKARNYRDEMAKKEYLSDMIKRIECLAEARDYLQEQIDTAAAKRAPARRSGRSPSPPRGYGPPRPTKKVTGATKNPYATSSRETSPEMVSWGIQSYSSSPEATGSYYSSSPESTGSYRAPARPSKQNKKAAKEAKRVEVRAEREAEARKLFQKTDENKYILRFQHLGLEDLDTSKCADAAREYMEVWETEMERNPDDEDYQERAEEAVNLLQEAIDYFEDTLATEVSDILSPYTYNAGADEHVWQNSLGGYGSSDNEDAFGNRYD
jgi:hypothetical protein